MESPEEEVWEIAPQQLQEITAFIKENAYKGHQVRVRCDNRTETPMIWHWTALSEREIREKDMRRLATLEEELETLRKQLSQ